MYKSTIGYAFCGSFCTFKASINALKAIPNDIFKIIPIMSFNAYSINTRFGKASDFIEEIESICHNKIIHTIEDAEPIGPKSILDALIISPCTGN
ncbi:MAG: flavoprotein, partial [Clostridia bacterium]